MNKPRACFVLAALLWLSLIASKLAALPTGAEVVAGEAAITEQGPVLQVEQTSQRAIINYQDFDIAAGETVNFNQPNADAVVLNRVVGGNLAEIYGQMNANGQVYLINPNGILVGQGAQLNVGGLLLTTLDIEQEDFLTGRDQLAGSSSGRVESLGSIDADGQVVLVAPEVINGGTIRAPHGEVALRSANRALLQTPGSGIPVLVDEAQVRSQVINTGRIEAAAVQLSAAGNLGTDADPAITNTGVVRAVRASGAGGVIELLAPGGDISNSGSLDASASSDVGGSQGSGGQVAVEAERIANSGQISAAAATDGDGGKVDLHASDSLALFGASLISADGAGRGQGGEVWVVAEKDAWFTDTAHISARAGGIGGDGGFVEFSGHQSVSVNGWVDVSAVNGKAGLWYIDPTNISITNTDSNGGFTGGNPKVWTFTGSPATSQINIVGIENTLTNGSNVTINTASAAASAGNIVFNGVLDVNGLGTVRTLTLIADGSVTFQSGAIWDSNLATATDGLNINVTAGTGITVADGVGINSTLGKINFITTTGDATITGLGSNANAADAIQVTASAGRILDGGDIYWDTTALVGTGGVILSARDGINIGTNANTLNLLSSNGDVSVVNLGATSVSRLSGLTTAYLAAGGAIQTNNATTFGGANVQFLSTGNIVLPSNGMTVTGNLTLQGNDIVDQNGSRTVSVGAGRLIVASAAAGGNSIFNTNINELSVSNTSANSLTFNDVDALTTVSISPFSGAININSGAGTDLTVGSQIELNDETGALTFNAGKDLIVNGAVADSIGAISNNNALSFTAASNIIFNAGAQANAGAGSLALSVTNGNISLGGPIAGATMSISAAGAAGGNITSNTSLDINGFGGVRTLNLNATGIISFTGGTIADSDTSSASDGLNINATAGTGFSVAGNTLLSAGAGKINITTTLGNASVTGLSSNSSAADAISVTASFGSVLDGGDSRTDISAVNGGAILSGQFGITAVETDVSFLDVLSAAGDITLTEAGGLTLSRISALDSSSLTAGGAILTTNSTVFGGNDLNLITSNYIQVPQLGISMPDLLLLNAADVRAESGLRTLSLAAHHLFVDTDSSGGNLQINSTTNLLTLKNTGSNIITLNDTDALLLASVRPQGGSTIISSGAGSDLTLANAPIELNGSNGVLTLNAGADLIINQSAEDTIGAVNNATTINLNATNNITFTSGGRVNAGTGTITLNASGGDVALGRLDGASVSVTAAGAISDANGALVNINSTSATLTAGTSIGSFSDALDTTLASLSLTASNGGAYLANSQGLSLTSASVNGDFSLSLPTSGNLTLVQSAPVISGAASFNLAAGQLIIPDAGWTTGGNLTISATNLVDSNNDVSLGAAAANITLSSATANRSWSTNFTSLALALTGAGDFGLTDGNALLLNSVSTGGNASFTSTNADLSLAANTSVAGTLSLITTGSGNLVVPVGGLTQSAGLSINANDLLDTDRTLSLGASDAAITLRSAASSMVWNTSFNNLTLALTGGGSLTLTDSNALTLVSASSSADASFTATNGDLTLSADPAITGNLSLLTTGSGNVIIPTAGISQPAALTINANDFLDTDRNVTLAASTASITLRNAAAARNWNTSFNDLVLSLTGTGDFALIDDNALTLTSATTGGNASFAATNADLTLSSDPAVTGNLSLITTGTGNVIIPTTGIVQPAALTINANDVLDTDRDLILAAGAANITLRNASAARNWTTSFTDLILSLTGTGAFALTDTNALNLTSATTGGDANFATTNADLTLVSSPAVSGALSLNTTGTGNVIIPLAGISTAGALSINANDLLDTDRDLSLTATSATISLRDAASARNWTTSFNDLVLSLTGTGDFALTDDNALTLTSATIGGNASFTTTNADLTLSSDPAVTGDLSLVTTGNGNVIIPTAGISQPAALSINANDVLDTDRDLTLAAGAANITLRNASAARNWTTSFTDLIMSLTGTGAFALTDTNALNLTSATTGGDASFATTNADLTLVSSPAVSGALSLTTTGTGNVIIPLAGISTAGALSINANDLLDTDRDLSLAATSATITLRNAALARNWTTSFNDLVLSLTGSGDFALTDSNALTLTSATTGGNASFTTTNADITLSSDPAVTGNLSLITIGTGNVIIPTAGISQPAALSINANDVLDTDRDLILAAGAANITLRNASAARNWTTSFTDLILSLTGTGAFALTDTNALNLTSATTGGDASFTTTNADLTLVSSPTVSGTLSLTTTGTGNVIIPLAGISTAGALSINANDLLDTDRDLSLAATSATISLRDAALARNWTTSFNDLVLSLTGTGDFALTDSNALTLTSATTGGNASFTTTNADLTLISDPAITGNLSLITSGTGKVIIPTAGISQSAALTINANDVLDTDRDLTLAAGLANITLRDASAARTWNTSFSDLSLALTGAGDFALTDTDGLNLAAAISGGNVNITTTNADLTLDANTNVAGTLNLTTTGTGNLNIPVAGFAQSSALNINANDLLDSDRDVTLAATNANITLRNASSARSWATNFNALDLSLTGSGDFALIDSNALTLASATTGGNASFTATNADLTLSSDPAVSGNLSLNTTGIGNVVIPTAGISQSAALTINANDILDTDRDLNLAAGAANITLRNAASAHNWTTSFTDLILSLTGMGAFTLTDTDGLNLTTATTGGDASFTTTNADLTLASNPAVSGNLSLNTTGAGNVTLPLTGISAPGALSINANDLLDTDHDLSLTATNANITLRNAASARTWATNFNNLILSLTGNGDFALTDDNALTLISITTGGNASFTATNADLTLSGDPAVTGNLSLNTTGTGNVVIPVTGISQSAGLSINANDVLDTDRDLTLVAGLVNINLRDASAARTWNTSFTDLNLALTGAGDFTLTDTDGLNLAAATSGGNVNLTTTNADLTLAANTNVAGILNLTTTGTGNLIVPVAGFTQSAALNINANDLLDADRDLTLVATNANIALRNAAAVRSWATSFNNLILSLTGSGDFSLTDDNALTLTSITAGGNASFTATNADLTLSSDPAVTGNLSLNTIGTGNVVIPVAGISQSADLTVNANDVLDTDRDLTLAAGLANITLRDASVGRTWNTSFTDLNLALTGAGDFTLTDTDGLNLNSATSGGNVSLTTTNADLSLGSSLVVAGNLSLFTTGAGNLYVPTAGINQAGALIINAHDLQDTDRDVSLAASSATITLRNAAAARNWNTNFNDVTLSLTGGGDFALTDNNALTITAATTGGNARFTTTNGDLTLASDPNAGGNLSLNTLGSGRIILPVAGISEAGNLTINADDVLDTDTNVSLAANDADINLRAASGSRTWNTAFDRLSLSLTGGGDFNLINSGDLIISALNSDGGTGFTSSGDLNLAAVTAFSNDLNLAASGSGAIILPAAGITITGDLIIDSHDLMDADRDVQLSAANADITLRSANQARSWTTDFGSLTLTLNGGGDFTLVDTNGLTLNAITTGGNAGFTASNNNLVVTANPQVGGNLSLAATGAGAVVVPTAGINQTGNLTISARDLIDTDKDIILAADNASINLRNAQGLRNWNTTINCLDLTLVGAADLTLTNSQALTIAALNSDGSAGFTATNAALTLAANPNISGHLSLLTTGNGTVFLPLSGLTLPAALTIDAQDLLDTNRDISLAAADATITLRDASGSRNWQTNFNQLNLSLNGNGDFNLIDADALTLTALNSGGNSSFTATNGDLTLANTSSVNGVLSLNATGSGNLIMPAGGINHGNGLSINANDILDNQNSVNASRDLSLTATNADITLRGATGARTWATDFTQLNLALSGGGDFVLTDANGLNLNSVVSAGNTHFTATGANLVVLNNPQVAGYLGLSATGAGSVVIPATGINHGGALTINAADLQDTDLNLILAANNGQITLRNAVAPRSWATDFAHLALNLMGGGDLSIINSNALSLDAAQTAANLTVTTTNADLTLPANTQVTGNLNLTATGAGNVIVPNAGFTQAAGISIDANNVLDTDRDINLTATDAVINLRGAISSSAWQTQLNNLSLGLNGGGDFTLTNNQQLTLASVQSPGNVSITTAGDLTLAGNPAVAGRLALNTSGAGNVIIPQTGISQLGALSINANDILDADGDISLAATSASINLRSVNTARTWATSFADLALSLNGSGAISLTDSDALNLSGLTSQGDVSLTTTNADLALGANTAVSGTLNLNATGTGAIILPATGFSQTGALTINANDLLDGDRDIRLTATAANITLRNAAASRTWQSDLTSLNLSLSGGGDFALTDANGLTLNTISSDGNAAFTATQADLILAQNPQVLGNLYLAATGSGNLIIPASGINHGGSLTIAASDMLDTDRDLSLAAGDANINLRALINSRVWTSQLNAVSVNLLGGGDLIINNTGDITLNAAASPGALSINTNNATIRLAADSQIAGGLNLNAAGTGAVVLPGQGFNQSGGLTINAFDLLDSDHAIDLGAQAADITLRSSAARSWNTNLASLSLNLSGLAPLSLTNAQGLTLNAVSTQGDASFTSLGDLTLAVDPAVAGTLSLITQGNGALVLPTTGLTQPGLVVIDAQDLRDNDRTVNLAAARAQITLRNAAGASNLDTRLAGLDLTAGGPFAININDADDLSLGAITTAGDLAIRSVGNLDVAAANFALGGKLSLTASDQVQLSALGLSLLNSNALLAPAGLQAPGAGAGGDLIIRATGLEVAGGGPVRLAARSADIALSGSQPLSLAGQLDELALSTQTEGAISISNDRDLNLLSLASPQASSLNFAINGALRIPASGLTGGGQLAVSAFDLFDDDRTLSLAAEQMQVSLSAASGQNLWNLAVDELDIALTGRADLTLTDSQGLILRDLNNDGKSLALSDGNLALRLASGDLSIRASLLAEDASPDAQAAGGIDLAVAAGSIESQGALSITARSARAQPAGSFSLRMVLGDTSGADRSIRLGAGAQVTAIGGDILLDTRPQGTAAGARRTYVQEAASGAQPGAQVSAYTNKNDPTTGRVTLNGAPIVASNQQSIGANRWLAIVADGDKDLSGVLDQAQDLSQATKALEQTQSSGLRVDEQFGKVFGDCDEFDPKTRHRCKVNSALKAFLSHWLVGGELPSKREQN